MKYIDEFRDPDAARRYADTLARITTKPWTIMEVCGGQTHAIIRFGIDQLLPEPLRLIHGPGCPVCVTPIEIIDVALELAARPDVIFCSFGDMLRVPGSDEDLFRVKSRGGDVRIVYSPMDALQIARQEPDRQVVFFAVGFETTAPANAMAVAQAAREGVENFSILVSHVLVPPAIRALLASETCQVQGFLAAGHVCMVMGTQEYEPLAAEHKVPIVVTGFEPLDILQGLTMVVKQLEEGRAEVENQYARIVQAEGNRPAIDLIREVFTVVPRRWRGLGDIPASGLGLAPAYERFDAVQRFGLEPSDAEVDATCRSGEVLQGLLSPPDCPAFGTLCTPEHPLGATMVSAEGACAAYYRYRRHETANVSEGDTGSAGGAA